jgi:hypothetical protein
MPLRKLTLTAGMAALLIASSCGEKAAPPRTYPMGERVQLGHLIYTAFETQWLTQLGEAPNARVPQHRFMLLRVSITNAGSTEVLAPSITLVDDAGQSHAEVSGGEGVPQWIGLLRQVKPAESAQGNLVFDVPPKHYKLQVSDETEQRIAYIDIPLTFGAETPELPGAEVAAPQLSSPGGKK